MWLNAATPTPCQWRGPVIVRSAGPVRVKGLHPRSGFIDACLDGLPVAHDEREAIPRGHLPATGKEDRADAVLAEQPVLDWVVADALVAADRNPASVPDNR